MKKKMKYSLFALLVLTGSNLSNAISQEYRLQVSLAGDAEGRKVYLKNAEREIVDSTVVRDGQLRFTGTIEYPALYTLTVKNEKQPNPYYQPIIPIFLEDSIIDIFANVDSLSMEAHFGSGQYKYDRLTVRGSASHQVYMDYLQNYSPFFEERKAAFRKYLDYLNYGGSSKTVQEGIVLIDAVDKTVEKRNHFIKQYIMDHAESLITIGIATDYINFYSVLEIEEIMAGIPADILATAPGSRLLEKANKAKRSAVGAKYTDLSFEDDKGNAVRLSDYVGKGKYVLLEFWASWCVPCRSDIPHIKEVYNLYNPEGFEIISISMDSKKDSWLKAVEQEQMPWLQISDLKAFKGEVSEAYNFGAIPTAVLVDPEGMIVSRNMRGSWMDKKLIELYGDKF